MSVPNNDLYAGPWVLPIGRAANLYVKNLAATVAPTALLSAPPQGLYRVSLAMAILTAGTAGDLTLSVTSHDSAGGTDTQSLRACSVPLAGDATADTFVLEITAAAVGSDINYQVTAAGLTAGSLNYSIRAVVERLSLLT